MGGVFQLFWENGGISRNWTVVRLLTLMICLETLIEPVGVSFSLLMWSAYRGSGSSRSWLICHLGPIWIDNVICSDKDRPRDYHTKWSKSVRERQWFHLKYHSYVESSFFKRYNWTYLQNRHRLTAKTDLWFPREHVVGRIKSEAWDEHTYITTEKTDNQQGPTV